MSLPAGTRLGSYEVLALLGAGGMGEVYRARDTKLNRDVALKILPEAFTFDRDRLARFSREAQVLASLNHPNIAAIYGVEESPTSSGSPHSVVRALVLELVDGPTLAERIAHGPLPLGDALFIARQIAEALEAAHDKGIVHRDLKPANVKAPADGPVKVLDLGLALPASEREAIDSSNSPTLTIAATEIGLIMGTAAYMSPEQASGKRVDKRADIWSFGVVLWEMLTGRRLFEAGETVSHTLADVLRAEIDFGKLPSTTPTEIRELLKRCLDRDVKTRLRDIGEARVAIQRCHANPAAAADSAAIADTRSPFAIAGRVAAAALVVVTAGVSVVHFRETAPPPPQLQRFYITAPAKTSFHGASVVSPDGRYLVFVAGDADGDRLWLRPLDSLESRPLAGTEGVTGRPFWSFDSRQIAFSTQGKLKKVDILGGPVQAVCDLGTAAFGGFWTDDNRIVFGGPPGLRVVPAAGGNDSPVTVPDRARREQGHVNPTLLPDGRHFVYTRFAPGSDAGGVYVGSLDARPEQQSSTRLLPDYYHSTYVDGGAGSRSGYLLFMRGNTLMARPLDAARQQLVGEAVPIAEQIANVIQNIVPDFSVSSTGVLVYRTGAANRQLTWYDRQGKATGTAWNPGQYGGLALSPDDSRVSVFFGAGQGAGARADIWWFDFAAHRSARLTSNPENEAWPVWSADGTKILYVSAKGSTTEFLIKAASGAGGEQLVQTFDHGPVYPTDWSRDGRFVVYVDRKDSGSLSDLAVLDMEKDRKPAKFLATQFNEGSAKFSPDGRYLAYVSDESGHPEVYVGTFPDPTGGKWPISSGGGYEPRWRRDGKELLYLTGDTSAATLMSVDVTLSPSFNAAAPRVLFQAPTLLGGAGLLHHSWDLTADGQRFLISTGVADTSGAITVVLNWHAAMKK